MSRDLTGRVAIVTGGTRGIGAAIVRALAADGASVAAGCHRSTDRGETLRAELAAGGASVSLHQGNVGEPVDCQRVVAEVLEQWGRVDILVNNAGVTVDRTVRKMSVADWHAVLRINLSGAFYMTKALLDHMVENEYGRIISISSVIGSTGNIGQANYAASKSGLFGFTKSLAQEVARRNVTVNCVTPGFIATEMVEAVPVDALARIVSRIPVARLGRPDEIARAVRFLADDEAGYITGSVLAVNGGLEM